MNSREFRCQLAQELGTFLSFGLLYRIAYVHDQVEIMINNRPAFRMHITEDHVEVLKSRDAMIFGRIGLVPLCDPKLFEKVQDLVKERLGEMAICLNFT